MRKLLLATGWKLFRAGEHAHFGWVLLEYFLDVRGWFIVFGTWAVTFFGASLDFFRSPLNVWLLSLFAAACASILYIAWCFWKGSRGRAISEDKLSTLTLPQAEVAQARRDVGVSEAIAYICFKQWGKDFGDAAGTVGKEADVKYRDFLQAAVDGVVTIWGQRYDGAVYETIPADYWRTHQIEWFQLLKGIALTESSIETKLPERRYFLMTSRAEVERQWP